MSITRLRPGTRVAIQGHPIAVELTRRTGVVVRAAEWDDYYIIRLDAPAYYHHADGRVEALPEIREAGDNLTVLDAER